MRKNSRSKIFHGYPVKLVILLFPFLLFECQSSEKKVQVQGTELRQQSSDNITQLNWMAPWYGEGSKEQMMREAGRNFAFIHQAIDLETKFTNEAYPDLFWWTAVSEGMLDMIEKDEWPYDVLICEKGHYKNIATALNDPHWAEKYLVDFSKEDWFVEAHREGVLKSESVISTYEGIVPGPLLEGTIYILYVSTEVEEKLGIQAKRLDMTFDDFLEYAKVVYQYNQTHSDKIGFFSTQDASAVSRLFKHLTLTAYGKEKFLSKQASYKALATAYEAFEELSKYKPTESFVDYGELDDNNIQYQLNEKDYLFNMEATWIYNIWEGSNPEGVKVMRPCELPSIEGKTPTHYEGDFQTIFAVPKRGKHVEEAKKLIRYLTSSDIGEEWIKNTRCPTGLKTRISMTDFGQGEFDVFFRHMEDKYGINFKETDLYTLLWGKSPSYPYDEVTFNADFMHQDVLNGNISAREALRRIKQKY